MGILEKIMYDGLYSYYKKKESFYKHKFGFRNNRSDINTCTNCNYWKYQDTLWRGFAFLWSFSWSKKGIRYCKPQNSLLKTRKLWNRRKSKDWFISFLHKRQKSTWINGQNYELNKISHGVPRGSLLGSLFFIILLNDLQYIAICSKVHYFANDTNLLFCKQIRANKSLKKINKCINCDLDLINKCLRASKISLNTTKTKIIIFCAKNKKITKHLNFWISG